MQSERPAGSPDPVRHVEPFFVPGLVFLALVVRLWHIRHGLPDFLEPAEPLRAALALRDAATGAVDWNPHSFLHPSLTIYLHFVLQQVVYGAGAVLGFWHSYADYLVTFQVDPSFMVVVARMVGIVCDAFAVVAAYRLGRRLHSGAGLLAGLLVACAPTMLVMSRSIATDTVMAALALWALERMIRWYERGGLRRLAGAALLAGLAAGAEYPGLMLALPLMWVVWRREVRGAPGRGAMVLGFAVAAMAATFVVTTPYAVLDPHAFGRDFGFLALHAADGFATGLSPHRFAAQSAALAANLGGPMVLLVVGSLGLVFADARRRVTTIVLWLAFAAFGIGASIARGAAEPAMLPLIAVGAVLGAATLHFAVSPFRRSVRRVMLALLLATTAGPNLVAGLHAAWIGSDTTNLEARRWSERFLRPGDVMVQEDYSARLYSESQVLDAQSAPEYRLASPDARSGITSLRTYGVVTLPPPAAGRIVNLLQPERRAPREIEVFPNASDLAQAFYDPRLYTACDYVMTSGAVRAPFELEPRRYPVECALYRLLDATCEVVVRFAPHGAVEGPEIRVYRIGSHFRSAVEARGALDSLWWSNSVPNGYRALAGRILAPPPHAPAPAAEAPAPAADDSMPGVDASYVGASGAASHRAGARGARDSLSLASVLGRALGPPQGPETPTAPDTTDGDWTPPWVRSLSPVYDEHVRRFAEQMSVMLARSGRYEAASRFALATLAMHPEDDSACMVYSVCARSLGLDDRAQAVIERALAARRVRPVDPGLRLEYARVLEALGQPARARAELTALTAITDPHNAVAAEARRILAATP